MHHITPCSRLPAAAPSTINVDKFCIRLKGERAPFAIRGSALEGLETVELAEGHGGDAGACGGGVCTNAFEFEADVAGFWT